MSKFGDWWVAARDALEADVEKLYTGIEPELQAALVSAVQAGVAAARAAGGSAGNMWVAARDAAVQILTSQGKQIGAALVEQAVTAELATPAAPAAAPPTQG